MEKRSDNFHPGSILEPSGIGLAFLRMADRGRRLRRPAEPAAPPPPGRPVGVG